jgi:lipopolysaccharide biosynthesis glycosyltransferase
MNKVQPIHVVFTVDENFVQGLGVTMISLLETRNVDIPLRISIIGDNLSAKSIDALTGIAEKYNVYISFPSVNFEAFNELETSGPFCSLSRAAYGKLAIPDIINDDKILYLDSDILVRSDVSPLWDIYISEYYVGAVVDPPVNSFDEQYTHHNQKLGIPLGEPYFNAGVMLMNLKKCRQEHFTKKAIEFKLNNPGTGYADQDAFNAIMWGKWFSLHPCWNVIGGMFEMYNDKNQRRKLSQEVLEGVKNPAIVHFTGINKPFTCENSWPYVCEFFWPYFEEYYKYANMSPWKSNKSNMSVLMGTLRKHRRKFKSKLRRLFAG